ncbi:uncharacterized protein N7515_004610 [Penicillium bovifimosum]|uniref:Xylanolytic transcriptional activator regulatory domain-containing protein n=1 Tax=Penicillium bovifimosum TaxID=126998 RepID=A0A9W9L423_9EURO|nr:uncharacterized protein N7515_004610 [Penicillium bovifimosum]KAJ5135332.1 hypothetical protein N7515_004610 [Penicillium bovifimosum]
MTDVAARLEQLERSIAAMVNERPTGPSQGPRRSSSSLNHPAAADCPAHRGFLGKDGRYINEPLLSRVLEKEQDLQSAIGSPSDASSPRRPPVLRAEGFIVNPLLTQVDILELCPSRWQATVLWQAFLSRVDALIKVIHVPSTQSKIFAAINRPEEACADVRALLFAICFAATTTLVAGDIRNENLHADLRRYQQGMEISLYQSEFLDAPTLTSLQAVVIYQYVYFFQRCLRYSNSGRSGWTLQGVTIRAAQSIGLHRDGKHFKLPEIECEMRRRIWWHIQSIDCRVAEDHGLSVPENDFSDTEMPLNIDDQNLSETNVTIVPAVSQNRWTEMTFSLIIMEIGRRGSALHKSLAGATDPEQLIAEFKGTIEEKYLRHSDTNIPIQRLGLLLGRVLLAKFEVCIRQRLLQKQGPSTSSLDHNPAQEILALACHAMELALEAINDELLHGYRWLTAAFTQYHLLTFILWNLCVYPTGPHVERAWRCLDMQFALTEDPSWPDPGPKWPMIVLLRDKARSIRQAHCSESSGVGNDNGSEFVDGLGNGGLRAEAVFDIEGWELDFSDWNSLAQTFPLMG